MVSTPLVHVLLLVQVGFLAFVGVKADTYNCTYEMDLAFVVDASGSICDNEPVDTCDNWKACLAFIHNIVNDMNIGINDVRVAMIEFESSAWLKWNLTTYDNKAALLQAIDNLRYTGGNTDTVAALDLLSTVFSAPRGDRPAVRNQAILITDGKPKRSDVPIPMDEIRAAVKRVTDQGIRLLVVGVTESIDMETLVELSSPPHTINETVFVAQDYQNLEKVLRQLEIQNCINITEQPPFTALEPPQCSEKVDLCFVVDGSGSICDSEEGFDYETDTTCNNWMYNVNFIRSVANYFDIGFQETRIGLVIFTTTSIVMWNLTAIVDKSTMLNAITNLTYQKGGTTDMSGGLMLMRTKVFSLSDDRPDVPNTAVVITDGYPTRPETLQGEIDAIRQAGIRVLVVGVTDKIDLNTIQRLASPPAKENETYFLARDYASLEQSVAAQLSTSTCFTPTPQSTPPTVPDIPPSPPTFPTYSTSTTPPTLADGGVTPSPRTDAPVCSDAAVDLGLLIDASGSICDTDESFDYETDSTCSNWNLILQFLHRLIDDIFSSPFTRVGLVKFSSQAQTVFNLDRYTDKNQLLSAVDNITYSKGGTTDMTGALHLARTEVFNTAGDRPGSPNTIVIITDGFPTRPDTLQAEIDAARNSSIRILALGVTHKVDESTLRRLSAPPHQINVTYFMALDYIDIESFREILQETICQPSN